MELKELLSILAAAVIGGIVTKYFQKSEKRDDKIDDLAVRQAVEAEKSAADHDRIVDTERDVKALWKVFDKINRGKNESS